MVEKSSAEEKRMEAKAKSAVRDQSWDISVEQMILNCSLSLQTVSLNVWQISSPEATETICQGPFFDWFRRYGLSPPIRGDYLKRNDHELNNANSNPVNLTFSAALRPYCGFRGSKGSNGTDLCQGFTNHNCRTESNTRIARNLGYGFRQRFQCSTPFSQLPMV
jgi:hypothetical protein